MGLSTKLDYEKVEMTARDVNRLLKMLWRRADDIPVPKPIDRIIFHALFLMLNYGGFRQGMVLGRLKFRDIVMAVMRDTDVPEKRRLVVTPTIPRNKLREDALEHKKGEEISFSTTLFLFYFILFFISFYRPVG